MDQTPVTIDFLHARFSTHFMADCTNGGAWRIAPRVHKPERSPSQWFDKHGPDKLRRQFWNVRELTLVCMDEHEATSLLIDIETEYRAWCAAEERKA